MDINLDIVLCGLSLLLMSVMVSSDQLDLIRTKMKEVDATNCASKSKADLTLSISDYQLGSSLITKAKKLALNRAILYSITNQKLNISGQFPLQPDLYYTYMSVAVSLASSPRGILATGLYYDQNTYYPNFYTFLPFNKTLKLFAPYASRDVRPSRVIMVKDDSIRNYTQDVFLYKTGEWFSLWFPDYYDTWPLTKDIFTTVNSDSNAERSYFSLGGSNPVKITQPYFDCGRTNKWVVTVSSPVVDYLPRYTHYVHSRRPRFVAVSTVDVDFIRLDIDQCGIPDQNRFSGTHKCKPSTQCQPVRGSGLDRGGYICVCKPGYTYQEDGNQFPYWGNNIESATDLEYSTGFECVQSNASSSETSSSITPPSWVTPDLAKMVLSVTPSNCTSEGPAVVLPNIPTRYIRKHLPNQIMPGFRLAQLICGSLQLEQGSLGSDFRVKTPHDLNAHLLAAEVEAIVFSDDMIAAAEVVLEKTDGQIISYFAKKSVDDSGNGDGRRLEVRQNHWTIDMLDARRAKVWIGRVGPNGDRIGRPDENIIVKPSMKPVPNVSLMKDMIPWIFQGPDDVHMEKPEYSCDVNSWVEKVSSAIIGPTSQSNLAIRGEVVVHIALPLPSPTSGTACHHGIMQDSFFFFIIYVFCKL